MLITVHSVYYLVIFYLSYHLFQCILKEPEDIKKAATFPSPPAKKPEVPKKGT